MICFYISDSLEFVALQTIIPYIAIEKNMKKVISEMKTDLVGLMEWFKINLLKANPRKLWFLEIKTKGFSISISIALKLKSQAK